jgi:Flavin containing amine oxidoreductase
MSDLDYDVVVVGAGLAGLRCAADLRGAGLEVTVLEATDQVGGRIRTDRVDGFRVDRGFQLLNPAYPAVRDGVDVPALGLHTFQAGVAARTESTLVRLGHPWHAPALLPSSAALLVRDPRALAALVRWARPLLPPTDHALADRLQRRTAAGKLPATLRDSLDQAGLGGQLRRVLDRFFAGVLLEDEGRTAAGSALLVAASFLRGTPGLPAAGMQALPRQLAAGTRVVLSTPVDRVVPGADGVVTHAGHTTLRSRAVVLATDPATAARFASIPPTLMRGVLTSWFATPERPTPSRLLHVDGRARPTGPLVNAAVVSNVAPSYAAAGQHLVEASALIGPSEPAPTEAEMLAHAGELLGASTSTWRLVVSHHVPAALPAQPPPFRTRLPVRLGDRLFVSGDHRDTASIQGALVSGRRAARAVLQDLELRMQPIPTHRRST